jgi:hypothetical protein
MKNSALYSVFIIVLLFNSCSYDSIESPLIGRWLRINQNRTNCKNPDNNGTSYFAEPYYISFTSTTFTKEDINYEGKYIVKGNQLTLDGQNTFTLNFIDRNSFTLTFTDPTSGCTSVETSLRQ